MYFLRCLEGNAMKFAQTSIPFPVDGKGSKGMGTDLLKQNYRISGISLCGREIIYMYRQEAQNFPLALRARRARGVTERNTSLHSGRIHSVQNSEAELQNFEAQQRKLKLSH
jgi:hypothetical protein